MHYDPSSAIQPAGRNERNRDAMAGFAAAHGYTPEPSCSASATMMPSGPRM
jgi:hypothetical protein